MQEKGVKGKMNCNVHTSRSPCSAGLRVLLFRIRKTHQGKGKHIYIFLDSVSTHPPKTILTAAPPPRSQALLGSRLPWFSWFSFTISLYRSFSEFCFVARSGVAFRFPLRPEVEYAGRFPPRVEDSRGGAPTFLILSLRPAFVRQWLFGWLVRWFSTINALRTRFGSCRLYKGFG